MKKIMIKGYSKTGKTTTVCQIMQELVNRGYSVGSVKDIHFKGFTMETEGSDTFLHKKAGAEIVAALSDGETNVMYKERIDINKLLHHYTQDYVVFEGDCGVECLNIVTGKSTDDLDKRMDKNTIAFAGVISKEIKEYKGIPVINGQEKISQLVDLIERS